MKRKGARGRENTTYDAQAPVPTIDIVGYLRHCLCMRVLFIVRCQKKTVRIDSIAHDIEIPENRANMNSCVIRVIFCECFNQHIFREQRFVLSVYQ